MCRTCNPPQCIIHAYTCYTCIVYDCFAYSYVFEFVCMVWVFVFLLFSLQLFLKFNIVQPLCHTIGHILFNYLLCITLSASSTTCPWLHFLAQGRCADLSQSRWNLRLWLSTRGAHPNFAAGHHSIWCNRDAAEAPWHSILNLCQLCVRSTVSLYCAMVGWSTEFHCWEILHQVELMKAHNGMKLQNLPVQDWFRIRESRLNKEQRFVRRWVKIQQMWLFLVGSSVIQQAHFCHSLACNLQKTWWNNDKHFSTWAMARGS